MQKRVLSDDVGNEIDNNVSSAVPEPESVGKVETSSGESFFGLLKRKLAGKFFAHESDVESADQPEAEDGLGSEQEHEQPSRLVSEQISDRVSDDLPDDGYASDSEPEVTLQPEPEVQCKGVLEAEPGSDSEAAIISESESCAAPNAEPNAEPDVISDAEAEAAAEQLVSEPELEAGCELEHVFESEHEAEPKAEVEPEAEPESEFGRKPDLKTECESEDDQEAEEPDKGDEVEFDDDRTEKRREHVKGSFFRTMTWVMVIFSAVVVALHAFSIVTAMKGRKKKDLEIAKTENLVNVSVKTMAPERFEQLLVLNADLKNLNGQVSVTAPVSGIVVSNTVKLGERVRIGDELGVMDASDIGVEYNMAPVISKTDGILVSVNAIENQKVAAGSIMYVIEPDPYFVLNASVSESDVDSLKLSSAATFVTAGDRTRQHSAYLSYISPVVNSSTKTVPIQLTVDSAVSNLVGLRNGNFVELTLVKSEMNNVMVVPKDAIRTYGGKDVVYVVGPDSIAKRVEVVAGLSTQSQAVITDGLSEGDRVVVQGSPQDGDRVQVL